MIELEKWQHASNYMGTDFSDYYVVVGKHRDSNYADKSNFIIALQRLGGEDEENDPPKVMVAHSSHWLVGWSEVILVHKDAEEEVIKATDIINDRENYYILDDDHYSQLKSEEIDSLAEDMRKDINEGNAEYWKCYGVTGNETDEELWDIAYEHVD